MWILERSLRTCLKLKTWIKYEEGTNGDSYTTNPLSWIKDDYFDL